MEKQSHNLERIMYMRNLKLKIIIGLIVLAILCYVLVPIGIKLFGSKTDNTTQTQ